MKTISFISTLSSSPWGGSEELWSQAALRLRQEGMEININVQFWPQMPKQIMQLAKAKCQIVTRKKQSFNNPNCDWFNLPRPDLVVISQSDSMQGLEWMQQCLKRRIPYANIVQKVMPSLWPHDSRVFELKTAYEKALASFFVSKRNLEMTKMMFCTPLNNAKIVKNPFKVNYQVRLSWPNSESNYKLACIARLTARGKGQDVLLEVMNQSKWRKRPIQITLFGDGTNRKSLFTLKEMLKLDNVTFGGFIENVESIWASHHALILPSRHEGLPLALVEAMLCARPCIVTNVGGNTELIEDNITGFVACAPKKEYLDEAMERAWVRRKEWQEIGKLAANKVREIIPPDPVGEFVEELKKII